MVGRISRSALLLCLACWSVSVQASEPAVVHTKAQLESVLASGRPTPLDALTPYGKRRLLGGIVWRGQGMGGFSGTQLVRELDAKGAQVAASRVVASRRARAWLRVAASIERGSFRCQDWRSGRTGTGRTHA